MFPDDHPRAWDDLPDSLQEFLDPSRPHTIELENLARSAQVPQAPLTLPDQRQPLMDEVPRTYDGFIPGAVTGALTLGSTTGQSALYHSGRATDSGYSSYFTGNSQTQGYYGHHEVPQLPAMLGVGGHFGQPATCNADGNYPSFSSSSSSSDGMPWTSAGTTVNYGQQQAFGGQNLTTGFTQDHGLDQLLALPNPFTQPPRYPAASNHQGYWWAQEWTQAGSRTLDGTRLERADTTMTPPALSQSQMTPTTTASQYASHRPPAKSAGGRREGKKVNQNEKCSTKNCSEMATTDHATCEGHRTKRREAERRRTARRIAQGLCIIAKCPNSPMQVPEPQLKCQKHVLESRARNGVQYRKRKAGATTKKAEKDEE